MDDQKGAIKSDYPTLSNDDFYIEMDDQKGFDNNYFNGFASMLDQQSGGYISSAQT